MDEALAAFGLVAIQEEEKLKPLYLWPENVETWRLFQSVMTQWYVSEGRETGLNYCGVEVVLRIKFKKRRERERQFALIQAMERATLKAWRELRENG